MKTQELIDILKIADPTGHRDVEIQTVSGNYQPVDEVIQGPPSELVPVIIVTAKRKGYNPQAYGR